MLFELNKDWYIVDFSKGESPRPIEKLEAGKYEMETIDHPDIEGKKCRVVKGTKRGAVEGYFTQHNHFSDDSFHTLVDGEKPETSFPDAVRPSEITRKARERNARRIKESAGKSKPPVKGKLKGSTSGSYKAKKKQKPSKKVEDSREYKKAQNS